MHPSHGSRVVVTGGAGFIGSHLCEVSGFRADIRPYIVTIDNLVTGNEKRLEGPVKLGCLRASETGLG